MRIMDEKMESVQNQLLQMCTIVEDSLATAMRALQKQDIALTAKVINQDDSIDELDELIENNCVEIIATQQPVGSDLRRVSAILKLLTDLERIGDYSVDIAEIVRDIGTEQILKPLVDIPQMGEITGRMLRHSIDAYIRGDAELARETAKMDEQVDKLYYQVYDDLLNILTEDPNARRQVTQLLFIGRYLERMADHATNICERVIYMVTGKREHY